MTIIINTRFQVLPKEIIFAVQSALPRKTLLRQVAFALAALHALDVPGSVQHVEQKAVQNRPLAAGAVDHGLDWANNPTDEAHARTRKHTHTHKQNQQHRPSIDRVSAFSLPDSPGAPGSMCAEKASRSGATTDFSLHA